MEGVGILMKRTLDTRDALVLYHRVMEICTKDDAIIGIEDKSYKLNELGYDFIVENLINISYIESPSIEDSRLYASNLVQIIISLSMRRDTKDVKFIYTPDDIVVAVFNTLMWCLENGYNAAIQDVKSVLNSMADNASSIDNF